jgi:hypothetical protein
MIDDDKTSNALVRQDFGGRSVHTIRETATMAMAAQAEAQVKARFAMALHRPRDMAQARQVLLQECKRPDFAEVARYSVPRGGKKIEGPSIRFAEAAARALGNLDVSTVVLYEDDDKRILRVTAVDLETNVAYSQDETIDKTVERKDLKRGQAALAQRVNSFGEPVYIIVATEDEMAVKAAARRSKAIRTCVLRLIDGGLIDEAMDACAATRRLKDATDPAAARKKVEDGFATIGVMPADLAIYLGCKVEQASPAQIDDLRGLFRAIKDGDTTWREVLADQRDPERAEDVRGKGTAGAKESLKSRRAARPATDGDPLTAEQRDDGALFRGPAGER